MALRMLGSFRREDINDVSDSNGVSFTAQEVMQASRMDVMKDDDCGEMQFILIADGNEIICDRRVSV